MPKPGDYAQRPRGIGRLRQAAGGRGFLCTTRAGLGARHMYMHVPRPPVSSEKAASTIGVEPALGAKRGSGMASLAEAEAVGRAGLAAAEDAAEPARTDCTGLGAQEGDEPEGDRLNERVERRIMDIEAGRVKMTRYTFDEYMRHLDDVLGG